MNIVNFSGGKDSTAMLLMMVEKGIPIDDIIYFDGGWEFPQMADHIEKVQSYINYKITILKPSTPFEFLLIKKESNKSNRVGYGWPWMKGRWCTSIKTRALDKHSGRSIQFIGIAYDEKHRIKNNQNHKYPLTYWKVTEKDALKYCIDKGFNWGGLYDHFSRVSCYCCPLKRLRDYRKLRKFYPELWQKMIAMDKAINNNRGFYGYKTVCDLENMFQQEACQMEMFVDQHEKPIERMEP